MNHEAENHNLKETSLRDDVTSVHGCFDACTEELHPLNQTQGVRRFVNDHFPRPK